MKRAVAAALIVGALLEFGGCSGKSAGPGDLAHPNVEPVETSVPKKNQRDYRTKGSNERPGPTPTNGNTVLFVVGLTPPRDSSITWSVGNTGMTESARHSQWSYDHPAKSGDFVSLLVENHSTGGRTYCMIKINGKLLVPTDKDDWNPYEHRNDAGDCRATAVVP